MVADSMPFCNHPANQFWFSIEIIAGNKKYRFDILALQRIQYVCRVTVFVSFIKRQIQSFAVCRRISNKIRVILPVLFLKLKAGNRAVLVIQLYPLSPALLGCIQLTQFNTSYTDVFFCVSTGSSAETESSLVTGSFTPL